jgi:hypothetical protein
VRPSAAPRRTLRLPIEGAAALLTTLGIMGDELLPVDPHLVADLAQALSAPWDEEQWAALRGPDADVELAIEQADALLWGLAHTEAASLELPWYPMVITTVRFVGDALLELWSDDEWLAYRG